MVLLINFKVYWGAVNAILNLFWLLVLFAAHKKRSKQLLNLFFPGILLITGICMQLEVAEVVIEPWLL
jgi:hypothetical protein